MKHYKTGKLQNHIQEIQEQEKLLKNKIMNLDLRKVL